MSDQSGGRRKRGRSGSSDCGRRLRPRKVANKFKGKDSPMVIVDEREDAGAGPAPVPALTPPDEQTPKVGETKEAASALTVAPAAAPAGAAAGSVHAEAAVTPAPAVAAAAPVHATAAAAPAPAAAAAAAAGPVHAPEAAATALVAAVIVSTAGGAAAIVPAAVAAAAEHAAAEHAAAAPVAAPVYPASSAPTPAPSLAPSPAPSQAPSSAAPSAAPSSAAAPPVSWQGSELGSDFNSVLFTAHAADVSEGGGGGGGDEGDREDQDNQENQRGEGGQGSSGNDGSALRACFALDALRSAPPAEVDRFKVELEKEEADIKAEMLAEQKKDLDLALWLGNLRNAKPYCLATCRIELAEEDAFVQPGVAGLHRLRATRKATVTKWGKQLLAERRILQKKKRARRASKATTKTEAEDEWSYLTCGPAEWYVRAKSWRSAKPMPLHELERASRPAPAASSEQAAGGTASPAKTCEQTITSRPAPAPSRGSRGAPAASCGQAARWTAPPAQPCRQAAGLAAPRAESDGRGAIRRSGLAVSQREAAEPTRDQGTKRDSHGVEKNEDYEAFLAEQRVLFEMAKDEVLEERRKIRKAWEGPGAQAYEQLAAEIGRKGGSEADFLEAKVAVDSNIQEWERQEFVAACGGRRRSDARPMFGEALDGGTARTPSDGLGGDDAAAAGGGATGMGLATAGTQEDTAAGNGQRRLSLGSNASASLSSAGGTDGEASDESPVRVAQPPSVVGLGKRKRQVVATESEGLEEPED